MRIDPIFTPDGWEDLYRDFFDEVIKLDIKPTMVTLGTYREKNSSLDLWREKWGLPAPELDFMPTEKIKEGTHFHIPGRDQIYKTIFSIIRTAYKDKAFEPYVSLCKETHSIRKKVGLTNANCNCLKGNGFYCG